MIRLNKKISKIIEESINNIIKFIEKKYKKKFLYDADNHTILYKKKIIPLFDNKEKKSNAFLQNNSILTFFRSNNERVGLSVKQIANYKKLKKCQSSLLKKQISYPLDNIQTKIKTYQKKDIDKNSKSIYFNKFVNNVNILKYIENISGSINVNKIEKENKNFNYKYFHEKSGNIYILDRKKIVIHKTDSKNKIIPLDINDYDILKELKLFYVISI